MDEKEQIVSEINKTVKELNLLFEKAASYYIKFDCSYNQCQSFGKGKVAHIVIKSYRAISPED